ncbi:ABC transporter [Amycolatopsis coloradensis]|uniref:Transport permease protein n=1 Tax=Amycolatopsis coloradensis TaxID=76021 RepID=A0A1R0KQP1_9PSEU|nr:ABC transporter permease [Amycolatopsis coloradensis]OLZ50005.1 ABC transporter [Amycolatopsis coloradensis]
MKVTAMTLRHLLHLLRNPGKILGVTLMPVSMVFVLGYMFSNAITLSGGGKYLDYMMAGITVQVGLQCLGATAVSVASELRNGLVDRFRSLPVPRISILLAQALANLALAVLGMTIAAVAGLLLGWRLHGDFTAAVAGFGVLLLYSFAMVWLGLLLGLLVGNHDAISALSALVLVTGSFLSSAFVPVQGLPWWLRTLVEWNPVSSVVTTCRLLWGNPVAGGGTSLPAAHPAQVAVGTLIVALAAAIPLSVRAYQRAVAS